MFVLFLFFGICLLVAWKICGFLAGICKGCFWRGACFPVNRTEALQLKL